MWDETWSCNETHHKLSDENIACEYHWAELDTILFCNMRCGGLWIYLKIKCRRGNRFICWNTLGLCPGNTLRVDSCIKTRICLDFNCTHDIYISSGGWFQIRGKVTEPFKYCWNTANRTPNEWTLCVLTVTLKSFLVSVFKWTQR